MVIAERILELIFGADEVEGLTVFSKMLPSCFIRPTAIIEYHLKAPITTPYTALEFQHQGIQY